MRRAHALLGAGLGALMVVGLAAEARAWGPEMHTYANWSARQALVDAGTDWKGLDLRVYLAASPAPDIWYAAREGSETIPVGIEEDLEYVRLLFAASRNLRQLSFVLGYLGHIHADVPGHRQYISPNGDENHHLIRDAALGFTLLGSYLGYPFFECPVDLLLGWALDIERGVGPDPGWWSWGPFDEEIVDLLVRAADAWCAQAPVTGCPATPELVRTLRGRLMDAVNGGAYVMTIPGIYAEESIATAAADMVRNIDDGEFGPGQGPALLQGAMEASADLVRQEVFTAAIQEWIAASEAPVADQTRLLEGPPPDGQWELEHPPAPDGDGGGGCATSGGPGGLLAPLLLLAWAGLRSRRRRRPA
jgi:uncharacterized protein (TIGR03382 family)